MNFGETNDPEAKRQKMDLGGIPLEHLHYTASTYAFPLPELMELARLTVDQMKKRLRDAGQSFNSYAKKKELFDKLIGLNVTERISRIKTSSSMYVGS